MLRQFIDPKANFLCIREIGFFRGYLLQESLKISFWGTVKLQLAGDAAELLKDK